MKRIYSVIAIAFVLCYTPVFSTMHAAVQSCTIFATSLPISSLKYSEDAIDDVIYRSVEQMPTFPGGEKALIDYLNANIQYPVTAKEQDIEGKVIVQFVVEKDGSVEDVKVIRSVNEDLDQEAIRVCKTLKGLIPGRQNGHPVRVWYTMPIIFKLKIDKKKH